MKPWPILFIFVGTLITNSANAELLDPEQKIIAYGAQETVPGRDTKSTIYKYTERSTSQAVLAQERLVAALPKSQKIKNICTWFADNAHKELLDKGNGFNPDIWVNDYGYSKANGICVLKYRWDGKVGTQVIYNKPSVKGIYLYFLTD